MRQLHRDEHVTASVQRPSSLQVRTELVHKALDERCRGLVSDRIVHTSDNAQVVPVPADGVGADDAVPVGDFKLREDAVVGDLSRDGEWNLPNIPAAQVGLGHSLLDGHVVTDFLPKLVPGIVTRIRVEGGAVGALKIVCHFGAFR